MNSNLTIVYSDGSSRGNPGPGGWAAIVLNSGIVTELGGRSEMTTNNRMEIEAPLRALEFLADKEIPSGQTVYIYTDSKYVLQGATAWLYGWKKNGWMTAAKEPVSNQTEWQNIDRAMQVLRAREVKIEWRHVPGHAGEAVNERCDEIATTFADQKPIQLYDGAADAYEFQVSSLHERIERGEEVHDELKAQKKQKKAKGPNDFYVSVVNGVYAEHATWAECEGRVKGVKGARFMRVGSDAEAQAFRTKNAS